METAMKKRYEILRTINDTPENRALKLEALMESFACCASDKCKDCAFVEAGALCKHERNRCMMDYVRCVFGQGRTC